MATQQKRTYRHLLLILGLTVGGSVACSGSKSDEEGLVPSTEADAEGAGAPEPQGDAKEAAESESKAGDSAAETAGVANPGDAEAAPAAAPAPAPAPASNMAATPPPSSGRVVRHVKVKQATLRSAPSVKSDAVGQLARGERIIVEVDNGWGRIADGLYIKLSDTAPKPVAAKRQRAEWMPPAH